MPMPVSRDREVQDDVRRSTADSALDVQDDLARGR